MIASLFALGVLFLLCSLHPFVTYPVRVRPGTLSGIAEFPEHETDGSEFEEGERGAVQVLPILG